MGLSQEPHSPLYFVLARFWAGAVGADPGSLRLLSALIALLGLPAIFWLCRELFDRTDVGLLAVLMLALSPFFLRYAQEARPYSLAAVTVLASSAALLAALRTKRAWYWVLYAVLLGLAFLNHLTAAALAVGHGIYVLMRQRDDEPRLPLGFVAAGGGAVLMLVPWLLLYLAWHEGGMDSPLRWLDQDLLQWWELIGNFLINLTYIFADFSNTVLWKASRFEPVDMAIAATLMSVTAVLAVWALWQAWRAPGGRGRLLLIVLLLTSVSLLLADLLIGGLRSLQARYYLAGLLAVLIAVAYLLALGRAGRHRRAWTLLTGLLLLLQLGSSVAVVNSDVWWSKYSSDHPALGALIEGRPEVLIIDPYYAERSFNWSGTWKIYQLLSLSHSLAPDRRLVVADVLTDPAPLRRLLAEEGRVLLLFTRIDLFSVDAQKQRIRDRLDELLAAHRDAGGDETGVTLLYDASQPGRWRRDSFLYEIYNR